MKNFLKNIVFSIIPRKNLDSIRLLVNASKNYWADFSLFYSHSTVFKSEGFNKMEALMIIDYHRLEKGMLFEEMKPCFAKASVLRLHKFLNHELLSSNLISKSQVLVAHKVMVKYYELHSQKHIDISDFFSESQYKLYRDRVGDSTNFDCAIELGKEELYEKNEMPFIDFAHSRRSVRNFTGEKVPHSVIRNVIDLALTSPSVCNRQANRVYLVENKDQIDGILKIQGGFNGYSENVKQLLILTNNRNYYYSIGERNQLFIDGGIFLMNLLYSLHYYKIANCPANWGKEIKHEKLLERIISIPSSEKIICLIPIGVCSEKVRVTLSKRRPSQEVFTII